MRRITPRADLRPLDDDSTLSDEFLEEVRAGEEAIRQDFQQWIVIGEGCRMKRRAAGAL